MIKKINEFGWEILPHSFYSPDITPTYYHTFRALQQFLKRKHFKKLEEVLTELQKLFNLQTNEFLKKGIESLHNR